MPPGCLDRRTCRMVPRSWLWAANRRVVVLAVPAVLLALSSTGTAVLTATTSRRAQRRGVVAGKRPTAAGPRERTRSPVAGFSATVALEIPPQRRGSCAIAHNVLHDGGGFRQSLQVGRRAVQLCLCPGAVRVFGASVQTVVHVMAPRPICPGGGPGGAQAAGERGRLAPEVSPPAGRSSRPRGQWLRHVQPSSGLRTCPALPATSHEPGVGPAGSPPAASALHGSVLSRVVDARLRPRDVDAISPRCLEESP